MKSMKDKLNQSISISITPGTIVATVLVLIGFYFLYLIRDLVLVLVTAIIIASAIEPGTRWFIKHKIPRVFGVLIIYLGIISVLAGLFAIFLPPLIGDFVDLTNTFPQYIETITSTQIDNIPGINAFLETITQGNLTGDIISKIGSTFSGATVGFLTAASGIFGGLLSFILIVTVSFYLAVQENGVENFIRIVTPLQHEKYVVDLWRRSQRKIGLWMQGQLLLVVIVGLLTYLGLSILGVSNAMFLAFIAALFELIPVFGPILAAVPAIIFALIDGGVTLGLLTAGLYIIIQQFESQLIHPLVVRKIIGIPALIAILALIIGGTIAGFLGIIISVPIAGVVIEILNDLEKKKKQEIETMQNK